VESDHIEKKRRGKTPSLQYQQGKKAREEAKSVRGKLLLLRRRGKTSNRLNQTEATKKKERCKKLCSNEKVKAQWLGR